MNRKERERISRMTEGLFSEELPIPEAVLRFFDEKARPSIGRGEEFVEYITEKDGLLFQRIFFIKLYGLGGDEPVLRECGRKYEGGKLVASNIEERGMMRASIPYLNYNGDMHDSGWVPKYSFIWDNSDARMANRLLNGTKVARSLRRKKLDFVLKMPYPFFFTLTI